MRRCKVPSAFRTSTTKSSVPSACVAQLRHGSKARITPSIRFSIPSVTVLPEMWANPHTLTAAGAGLRIAPRLPEICNYPGADAATRHVPCVSAFNLVADAHATGTLDLALALDAALLGFGLQGFQYLIAA
jgi:hypothetical protein